MKQLRNNEKYILIKFSQFEAFKPLAGTRTKYILTEDVTWEVGRKGSGFKLYFKKGDTFDISVPRRLEWAQSPHDRKLLLAALVHDKLLELGFDNAFASSEFRRAAIARGKNVFYSWVLFLLTLVWTEIKSHAPTPMKSA